MSAQYIITKNTDKDILAKVFEINQTEIKFKKSDNPEGHLYVIMKSEVLMIRYENRTSDVFNHNQTEINTFPEGV